MSYRKLSELVVDLNNPQKSDAFIKLFRAAVREGQFDAMDVPERFTVPKLYSRRGAEGTYQRQTRDMLYEATPKAEQWFNQTREALARNDGRKRRIKPSVETVESGLIDFKAAAEETRRKMQAKFEKGQKLGMDRAKGRK